MSPEPFTSTLIQWQRAEDRATSDQQNRKLEASHQQ
jgi:hypothetical protein